MWRSLPSPQLAALLPAFPFPIRTALPKNLYPDRGSPAFFQNNFGNGFAFNRHRPRYALRFATFPGANAFSTQVSGGLRIGIVAGGNQDRNGLPPFSDGDRLTLFHITEILT